MYRPQFAYATPDGYEDQDFQYSFDGNTNTPLLGSLGGTAGELAPGVNLMNITLPLQPDEVFLWRGNKVITPIFGVLPLYIQFRDPMGNYLSLCPVPIIHIAYPSGAAGWGTAVVPMEPEIPCPAGSNVLINVSYPGTGVAFPLPRVILYGVKRGPAMTS
jgi:hypothetical protein